jgi:RNA polymerase sigma-70 factor (ECF subfamily)
MDSEGLDTRACLERVRAGDEDAARALLNHLHPLVAKLVRAHLPQRMDEEDLVQMVFVKVFTKLDQFSGTVPVEHWVSRIAVNTCISQLHHERVRPELRWADLSEEQEQVVKSLAASPDELSAAQAYASRELVERLLERLSPADRLVVSLLHLEGRSLEEVGRITGWSTTLTKVRAFRARQKLRKHLRVLLKEAER